MNLLTSKIRYDQCQKEISRLNYEQIINTLNLNHAVSDLKWFDEKYGTDQSQWSDEVKDGYAELEAEQELYDTKNDHIATELEVLKNEMEAFNKLEQNGVKEATNFWCFGG